MINEWIQGQLLYQSVICQKVDKQCTNCIIAGKGKNSVAREGSGGRNNLLCVFIL